MKKQINKVIQIVKCSNKKYWYSDIIGAYVEVKEYDKDRFITTRSGFETLNFEYIMKKDCEFRYMSNNKNWVG